MKSTRLLLALCSATSLGWSQYKAVNPQVTRIVTQVSQDRITQTLKKLESFQTRFLYSSQDDPAHGIGAARRWIFDQFQSASPRLQVRYDQYRLKKIPNHNRITADVDLYNIVAVLPGKLHPDQQVIVSAHYDTINSSVPTGNLSGNTTADPNGGAPANPDPDALSPGVTDDGSGVACVLELARILSQYEFDKTLVFITFAGEEEGLIGSSLYAQKAKAAGDKIEALLNNDIIGSSVGGSGRAGNRVVSLFSDDPPDSPARTVARYIRDATERYVPSMSVELVFRSDRVGRGGDQTPFALEGYGAVRFSSPMEDYAHQHTAADTFEFTDVPYIAQVTRINAAAAASLAWAPKPPAGFTVTRGTSRYDAQLQWKTDDLDPDFLGYALVSRPTSVGFWERDVFLGKTNDFLLPDHSIDNVIFGIKAVDQSGNESLVVPFVPTGRQKRVYETY